MITVENLSKEYDGVSAVINSSFTIDQDEIFGLIGPNGAGKTTTLKLIAGLLEPTSGSITVAGYDSRERRMRQLIGFLPEESPVYEDMTPYSYLEFFADLYGVEPQTAKDRIDSILDRLQLDVRRRPLGNLSKGMRRKVAIARSLINDPEVLIYDEPASGLDPLTTNAIIEFVTELSEGRTVIFSAHNLYHVESLCDRIAIMVNGAIVTLGSLNDIQEKHGGVKYHVYTNVDVRDAIEENGRYRTVVDDIDAVETIRTEAVAAGGEVVDVRSREPSLEDIFLSVAEETP